MKQTKIIALALCLSLLAGTLMACSSGPADDGGTPNQDATTSSQDTATSSQDSTDGGDTTPDITPVTLRFSRWASGTEEEDFDAWISEFMEAYPHISIVSEYLPYGEYFTKLRTDLIAGNAADIICNSYSDWYSMSQSGVFMDFGTMPGAKDLIAQLSESAVDAFKVNGQQLSLPIGVSMRLPFINKDLFAEAGVPLPSQTEPLTTVELLDVMNQLRAGLDDDIMVSNFFPLELRNCETLT